MLGHRLLALSMVLVLCAASTSWGDMCFGGGRPPRPKAEPTEKKDGEEIKDAPKKQAVLGAGIALSAAFVSSGLYFARRRQRFLWPCVIIVILGGLTYALGIVATRAMDAS